MRILLVEDQIEKAARVCKVINLAISDAEIIVSESFVDGSNELTSNDFELLILDLVIPLRKGGIASQEFGINLLREILESDNLRSPNHIICLSASADAIEELGDHSREKLVHCVKYDELDERWSISLTEKAKYVKRRVDASGIRPTSYDIDLAIVTSYPQVELAAVLEFGQQVGAEFHSIDELHYYRAEWPRSDRSLAVVSCAAPTMGMTAACVTACKVINRFRPRYLIMTGIAAGTSKNLKLGDIIVAEYCYDYGSGKILETENGDRSFIPSPQQLSISPRLRALLQQWVANQTCMSELGLEWSRDGTFTPRLELGVMATGAAVVQSKELVEELLSHSRKVAALEMEAYGVFQAAHLSSLPKPEVLVAKSICDFADQHKEDGSQKLAAYTSAGFVYRFFCEESSLAFD